MTPVPEYRILQHMTQTQTNWFENPRYAGMTAMEAARHEVAGWSEAELAARLADPTFADQDERLHRAATDLAKLMEFFS